jgi:hypothetical protein
LLATTCVKIIAVVDRAPADAERGSSALHFFECLRCCFAGSHCWRRDLFRGRAFARSSQPGKDEGGKEHECDHDHLNHLL